MKEIEPIAYFRSPFTTKFGIPRQSGLVSELRGRIVFEPKFSSEDALRGLEGFDYVWLIWGFSANEPVGGKKWNEDDSLMVRPPRLGGNEKVGVFASRSPFRPNGLGLSSVCWGASGFFGSFGSAGFLGSLGLSGVSSVCFLEVKHTFSIGRIYRREEEFFYSYLYSSLDNLLIICIKLFYIQMGMCVNNHL